MRRGFTLIELLVASVSGGIILSALICACSSLWTLARESNEELQAMLQAVARRERLLTGCTLSDGSYFEGLYNITNRLVYSGTNNLKRKYNGRDIFPSSKDFVRGCKSKNSKGVKVSPEVPTKKDSYNNFIQDVTIYLWEVTPSGSYCRMPVRMTILSQDGAE